MFDRNYASFASISCCSCTKSYPKAHRSGRPFPFVFRIQEQILRICERILGDETEGDLHLAQRSEAQKFVTSCCPPVGYAGSRSASRWTMFRPTRSSPSKPPSQMRSARRTAVAPSPPRLGVEVTVFAAWTLSAAFHIGVAEPSSFDVFMFLSFCESSLN